MDLHSSYAPYPWERSLGTQCNRRTEDVVPSPRSTAGAERLRAQCSSGLQPEPGNVREEIEENR